MAEPGAEQDRHAPAGSETSDAAASVAELDPPPPARSKWLRRFIWFHVFFIAFVLIVRLAWGWYAERALQNAIAAARARGEPVLPADFQQPDVADEDNAVFYFEKAVLAQPNIPYSEKVVSVEMAEMDTELIREYPDYFATLLEQYQPALQYLRQMRETERSAWPNHSITNTGEPGTNISLSQMRQMAKIATLAAIVQSSNDDIVSGVEQLRDAIRIADIVAQRSGLISILVAAGIEQFVCMHVCEVVPDVQSLDLSHSQRQIIATSIRGLIEELLLSDIYRNWRRAQFGERAELLAQMESLCESDRRFAHEVWKITFTQIKFYRPLLKPLWKLNTANSIPRFSKEANLREMREATKLYASDRADKFPLEPRLATSLTRAGDFLGFDNTFRHFLVAKTRRNLAAIALAIRLYQLDHEGDYPASLAELVPAYLPAIPRDFMNPEGGGVRYMPQRAIPYVYGFGRNGEDDIDSCECKDEKNYLDDLLFLAPYKKWRPEDYRFTTPTPVASTPRAGDDQSEVDASE